MKLNRLLPLIACIFLLSNCNQEPEADLNIATAANVQFPMETIVNAFALETGIRCNIILGSSGKLSAQIQNGADFDLFLSANMKYPQAIYEKGLSTEAPKVYAYGKLTLWTMKLGLLPNLFMLEKEDIKHIAIANPKNAPYGIAAEQALKQSGLYDKIESKLVFGESINQANQFVLSGAAEMGFTAKSVVMSTEMEGQGSWVEIDKKLYDPIAQGMVLIKKEEGPSEEAKAFYDFLSSTRAQGIFENFGYVMSPD